MPPRASILTIACLLLHGMLFPTASTAQEAVKTVRLDGKALYIPEVKITKRVNPVDAYLFIGSFEVRAGHGKPRESLCTIDSRNNFISIKSPEKLLKGSTPKVLTQDTADKFLNGISWGRRQATYIVFNIVSEGRQPAVIEISTGSYAALFRNGKFVSNVLAATAKASGEREYLPVMLTRGNNIISIQQNSVATKPRSQMAVRPNQSQDLAAAWQERGGWLTKLVYIPGERADPVRLDWGPNLSGLAVSVEVRDVATNKIVLQKERVLRGRVVDDEGDGLAPGIYEVTYRAGDETASEFFMVGNPKELFMGLLNTLSQYSPDAASKIDIEAQLRRARILLSKVNYNALDDGWQKKAVHTFSSLATIVRRFNEGAVNIAKDQSGLHIRGFASAADGSDQFYRLHVPSIDPGVALPLVVIASTMIQNTKRPFIEGPVMANQREALLWARFAERHGFAVLWPGYRGVPDGSTRESIHINEAIQAVEKDHNIDKHRISIYATCGAGYNAGRLVSEYGNKFAALVYDRAVFDYRLPDAESSPTLAQRYETLNPGRHVLANKNLKIFVMHDNTRPRGHGPMELTTKFLEQAKAAGRDVVSHLSERPMTMAERMDKVFSWMALCRNDNPGAARAHFMAKAGYTGPISEIFATPFLVVEGTHAQGADLEAMQIATESLRLDYMKYFHGAECAVKKDTDVTQEDINNHSLILIGNPQSNSIWKKLEPQLPVKMTPASVMCGSDRLTGLQPFQAIVRHPAADDKYILMIGARNLGALNRISTAGLFTAWYDATTTSPHKIISKLDSLHNNNNNTK
jgi:hypothetical protein